MVYRFARNVLFVLIGEYTMLKIEYSAKSKRYFVVNAQNKIVFSAWGYLLCSDYIADIEWKSK